MGCADEAAKGAADLRQREWRGLEGGGELARELEGRGLRGVAVDEEGDVALREEGGGEGGEGLGRRGGGAEALEVLDDVPTVKLEQVARRVPGERLQGGVG